MFNSCTRVASKTQTHGWEQLECKKREGEDGKKHSEQAEDDQTAHQQLGPTDSPLPKAAEESPNKTSPNLQLQSIHSNKLTVQVQ